MSALEKLLDQTKVVKMCCHEIIIGLGLKKIRAEVESSDSLDIQVIRLEVKI